VVATLVREVLVAVWCHRTPTEETETMRRQQGWMLVVAGDAVRRMTLFRLLEREGHRATVADDGGAALAMLRAEPFDMVVLDVTNSLPDAASVLRQIRADPTLRNLPVLVTCMKRDTAAGIRCVEMGADDVLAEPFDSVLLRARIDLGLAQKRLADRETQA
jgi:DNA-binding response OmpR family regulator